LDAAKLWLNKDGGYSLRKFKKIMKREMEECPQMYMIKGKANEAFLKEQTIAAGKVSKIKDSDDEVLEDEEEEQVIDFAGTKLGE
jgi:hypothetical protein